MRNDTRRAFDAYTAQIATLNGVPSATTSFAVDPSIEQTLETRIQERADFLQQINVVGVSQQTAEVIGLGATGPVAGRTDTTLADREPRSIHGKNKRSYLCRQTNFDTYITYAELDRWAKFPDFQARLRNIILDQIARDRLMIGWNGTSAAETTDPVANPLLQDVNIGWLQKIRTDAPERVLTGVKIGAEDGANYRNLDAAALDAGNELLAEWYKDDTDVVAICGRSLVDDKYLALMNSADADKPTEKVALKTIFMNRTVGNRPAIMVPYFPAKSVLLTKLSNLSIYWQENTRRRQIEDQPKRNRIVDFNSVNEDYVIEDLEACAFIDGILTWDPAANAGVGGWV